VIIAGGVSNDELGRSAAVDVLWPVSIREEP